MWTNRLTENSFDSVALVLSSSVLLVNYLSLSLSSLLLCVVRCFPQRSNAAFQLLLLVSQLSATAAATATMLTQLCCYVKVSQSHVWSSTPSTTPVFLTFSRSLSIFSAYTHEHTAFRHSPVVVFRLNALQCVGVSTASSISDGLISHMESRTTFFGLHFSTHIVSFNCSSRL